MSFYDDVYQAVKAIPYGKVASYGFIAAVSGHKGLARQVGYALHKNPDPQHIPCYRVVFKDGSLAESFAFGGKERQKALLEAEGVQFDGEKVKKEFFC
ncbi:MAG: MGMT family protein [Christensenellales bacterium]